MEIFDFELGIVDYRNIIRAIKDAHNYDFSEYALTSMKHRLESFSFKFGIRQTDLLIDRLREDPKFFNVFIKEIVVETTEMFRDPSYWRYLRDDLLPALLNDNYKPRIWFPSCVSGEELFSLLIILKEQMWLDHFEVFASCTSDLMLNQVKSGYLRGSKIEVSNDNYERLQGKAKLSDYYVVEGDHAIRDISLLKNVRFLKQNINFDISAQDVKLIICRNQLIFFNQALHDKVLKIFYDSLISGGYLTIGVREHVGMVSSKYFRMINEAESIYKKI